MNQTFHKFLSSQIDQERCAICRVFKPSHICEICGLEELVTITTGNILMCESCSNLENKLQSENFTPEKIEERHELVTNLHSIALNASRIMDQSVQVRTDLFNAAVVAIVDLKNIIDLDESITNKHFALATELKTRFEHFQSVIFDKQKEIVDASNNQRAIQVYLNELANKLRAEEREKLKLSDINYKPNDVSKVIKVKTISVKKPKLDKIELAKWAKEIGIPEYTLAAFVTAKNCTIEAAANMIRQSLSK